MDRYWLLTWTAYGTWLPGDSRGFVGDVRDSDGNRVVNNIPGLPYDADIPPLRDYVRDHMTGEPVALTKPDADALVTQFQETASVRGWELCGASIMFNHTHEIIGVPGDPDPKKLLETCKSWATRALKKIRPVPPNGEFWTVRGSKRKLPNDRAVRDGVIYVVRKQPNPLAVYFDPRFQSLIDEWDASQKS